MSCPNKLSNKNSKDIQFILIAKLKLKLCVLWNVNSQSASGGSVCHFQCMQVISCLLFILFVVPLRWRQPGTEALYRFFQVVRLGNTCEHNVSRALWGTFFLLCTSVHSDSEMNWSGFGGQKLKVTATSCFMNWYLDPLEGFSSNLAHKDELIRFFRSLEPDILWTRWMLRGNFVAFGTNIYILLIKLKHWHSTEFIMNTKLDSVSLVKYWRGLFLTFLQIFLIVDLLFKILILSSWPFFPVEIWAASALSGSEEWHHSVAGVREQLDGPAWAPGSPDWEPGAHVAVWNQRMESLQRVCDHQQPSLPSAHCIITANMLSGLPPSATWPSWLRWLKRNFKNSGERSLVHSC